jgi:hypothetical protein
VTLAEAVVERHHGRRGGRRVCRIHGRG